MAPTRALANSEYTVGWIAALPLEKAAAEAMLDDIHGRRPRTKHATDGNLYILGRIAEHNVVIASLPAGSYGPTAATTTAMHMISSFPSIRIGLMVGIGGGIPKLEQGRDIRLGDVVVSQPRGNHGGVVQYDSGKRTAEGEFQRESWLRAPPRVLLNAIGEMQEMNEFGPSAIPQILKDMGVKYPALVTTGPNKPGYVHQGKANDRLFKASYNHPGGITCANCDPNEEVERDERDTTEPAIHYGVIASGHSVVKDAIARDALGEDCLCFEMEAAGLMNDFPCLVIRGICDYADSHKNKQWQRYAAATAAAYAKELLGIIPPEEVEETKKAADIVRAVQEVSNQITTVRRNMEEGFARTTETLSTLRKEGDRVDRDGICNWLSEVNYGPKHSDTFERKQEGTGEWLLNSIKFQKWLIDRKQTLLCHGIPGAGKTIITSMVIDYISKKFAADDGIGIVYIYCDHRNQNEQKLGNILAVILKQLIQSRGKMPASVKDLHQRHIKQKTRPSNDELMTLLHSVAMPLSRVFIIIDALDECQASTDEVKDILRNIFKLQRETGANFFATSRNISDIVDEFKAGISLEIRATDEDVLKYLDAQLETLPSFISRNKSIREEIKSRIIGIIDGMFLLAQLHVESLKDMPTLGHVKQALRALPKELDKTYEIAIDRIANQGEQRGNFARNILLWVTLASRRLSTAELRHAMAVQEGARVLDEDYLVTDADYLGSLCAGLVTIDKKSDIIRLVHQTTEAYFRSVANTWFPGGERHVSRTCITYLSFDTFGDGYCYTDAAFEKKIADHKFYTYAAQNWGLHTRRAGKEAEILSLSFLQDIPKVFSCTQALLAASHYSGDSGYSQRVSRQVTGAHLIAYFGLRHSMMALIASAYNVDARDSSGQTPLCWAAQYGNESVVHLLLSAGVEWNSRDYLGGTPLWWAARNGHAGVVKLLLGVQGIDPDCRSNSGMTPLAWAAENGHVPVVEQLITLSAVDINSRDNEYKQTPLLRAAKNGHASVVKHLLCRNSTNVESEDSAGRTAISWAAENGRDAVVRLLNTANLDSPSTSCRTPLSYAAENGHVAVVKLLLTMGEVDYNTSCSQTAVECPEERAKKRQRLTICRVDPDSKSILGRTPLSYAAEHGHEETVQLLLATALVDPASLNHSGRSPLSYAVERGHQEVALLLLSTNRIPPDTAGEALWWAASNGQEGVVKRLLALDGININYRHPHLSITALHGAAENNHEGVVKLLLSSPAINPDPIDSLGRTPLWLSAKFGHFSIANMLLDDGRVDLNPKDVQYHLTPLTLAAQHKRANVAKLLISTGAAKLDVKNISGRTPLSFAAENGQNDLVTILAAADNVDLNSKDNKGLTPLAWAKRNGQVEVVENLLTIAKTRSVRLDVECPLPVTVGPPTTENEKIPDSLTAPSLEFGDSWVRSSVHRDHDVTVTDQDLVTNTEGEQEGFRYLSSAPIGVHHKSEVYPVRKIAFTITSKDQGWSSYPESHGTYDNSWTWFEAVVRSESRPMRQKRRIVSNVHAGKDYKTHVVTWSADATDEEDRMFVKSIRRGDYIDLTVWAAFSGWENHVASARIDIFTAMNH
ncbi:hypothetical protein CNMCM7691_000319 [Aspergillus felis]|uniref:Nucleoside phosphorylase domain-containing protein n=1 Tax=Aspergillus felis TaxID=1287682 RepID=A0A8H6VBV6_9EURO|nr:hypothetical protein CNMCM7691_000319 [Aspergillus felis]